MIAQKMPDSAVNTAKVDRVDLSNAVAIAPIMRWIGMEGAANDLAMVG